MMKKKSLPFTVIILTLLLFTWGSAMALPGDDGYQIRFRVHGIRDTSCIIAYYYTSSTYIKDTVKVDGNGRTSWKAPADLPKGLYVFIITDKVYFDFAINNDRKFSMETSLEDPLGKMTIKDSPDNELFYKYLRFNKSKQDEMQVLESQAKLVKDDTAAMKTLSEKAAKINKDLIDYRLSLVEKYPDSFTAFMINAMREPEVPDAPILANGRPDSLFSYRYYKAHYWDGSDFTDDRLLRTPVFHNKLKKYYETLVIQNPDSVIREVDAMIETARPNQEMFKYLVWFFTYRYENPEYMGMDRVFVHMVDTYYITGQTTWLAEDVREKIIKKANKIRPTLLGQIAPNMIMQDTNFKLVSMHGIQAEYLVLLFWDPACGHCEKEMPLVKEFYDKYKPIGVEIFAVCADTNMAKMKSSIRKKEMNWINVNGPRTLTGDYHEQYDVNSTPYLYMLDRRKEIIAKRIPVDKLDTFLENYLKLQKKKNPQ